jgi:hypothetical protein
MLARHLIALLVTLLAASPAGAVNETPWMMPQPEHPSPWGLLEFYRVQGSAQPWDRAHSLTGN